MSRPSQADEHRRSEIQSELAKIGFCLPGTLTARRTRCSSPGCRCRAEPPALHGPYYSWTRKIAGKTITRTLSPEQAERYGPWFEDSRKLRALSAELETLTLRIAEATEGWGKK